jgi:hypothetical protein
MLEGVVERKSWLHNADGSMLVWHGDSEEAARTTAMRDLSRLERQLAEQDPDMPADGWRPARLRVRRNQRQRR